MPRFFIHLFSLLLTLTAFAQVAFPPPTQFNSGYSLPATPTPLPRGELFIWLDVVALALALGVAAWLALRRRSRRGLVILTIVSLLYFGFYRHGCICTVGAIQNVAQALGNSGYLLPASVALFFLLPLLVAFFAGRAFCSGVCPLGAMQELVVVRPLRVPRPLQQALGVLPFAYLGIAVLAAATGSAFLICQYDPFVLFFRHSGSATMLVTGIAFLLIGTVIGRPYCRFLCPYGALLRLVAPFTHWRVAITQKDCVNCRLCHDACPYGAILPPTPDTPGGERREGKARLALLLLALPLFTGAGALLGQQASPTLARLHLTVRTAELVWLADNGMIDETTLEVAAFRATSESTASLYARAKGIRKQYAVGSLFFGAWLGLVVGVQLVALSLRRRREHYEIDQGLCLACGRCYAACPLAKAPASQPTASGGAP